MSQKIPYWNDLNASGEPSPVSLTKFSTEANKLKRCSSRTSIHSSSFNGSIDQPEEFFTPPSADNSREFTFSDSPLLKSRTLHSSMENLNRPKNYRSGSEKKSKKTKDQKAADAHNKALAEENFLLMNIIEDNRKKNIALKVSIALTYAAIARRGKNIAELEDQLKLKKEECAARLILHHLLLNSWRNKKADLEKANEDNFQLGKTMENLALQLRIVRHLQNTEKERNAEKAHQIAELQAQVRYYQDETSRFSGAIEKMEDELNSMQGRSQALTEENSNMNRETGILREKCLLLQKHVEIQMKQKDGLASENAHLKQKVSDLSAEVRDLTEQYKRWHDEATSLESECWELKIRMERKDEEIKEMNTTNELWRQENMQLKQQKEALEGDLSVTKDKLNASFSENSQISKNLQLTKTKLEDQSRRVDILEEDLQSSKILNATLRKDLMRCNLKNVKRRRDWGNALYFFVNPVGALWRYYSNDEKSKSVQNGCKGHKRSQSLTYLSSDTKNINRYSL